MLLSIMFSLQAQDHLHEGSNLKRYSAGLFKLAHLYQRGIREWGCADAT